MLSLPGLIYLDPEKTGSTFIRRFLVETVKDTPEGTLDKQQRLKHCPTREPKRATTLYLASIRDPLAQYLSLYRFGRKGKGAFMASMRNANMQYLYQDGRLNDWLRFITSQQARPIFHPLFVKVPESVTAGPASLRLVNTCTPYPAKVFAAASNDAQLKQHYNAERLTDFIVRQESLSEDMEYFIRQCAPHLFDVESAVELLHNSAPVNTTHAPTTFLEKVDDELISRIQSIDSMVLEEGLRTNYISRCV